MRNESKNTQITLDQKTHIYIMLHGTVHAFDTFGHPDTEQMLRMWNLAYPVGCTCKTEDIEYDPNDVYGQWDRITPIKKYYDMYLELHKMEKGRDDVSYLWRRIS